MEELAHKVKELAAEMRLCFAARYGGYDLEWLCNESCFGNN